jgi:hypothetical protein
MQKRCWLPTFPSVYILDFSRISGLTGTAVEFMLTFRTRFHVDVTSFHSAEYFEAEEVLFKWSSRKVLTIADLLLGIEASKLDDTIIQGNGGSKRIK